jgi:hypothetical protein
MIEAVIIVLLILIIFYLLSNKKENLYEPVELALIPVRSTDPQPYIKLYDRFNKESLIYEFKPVIETPNAGYVRRVIKINLKSIELNLPKKYDGSDDYRRIEIWALYPGDNTSSIQSDFYNSYTEPDNLKTAIPGKYKLIVKLKAGEQVTANIMEPVKKIFLFGRL